MTIREIKEELKVDIELMDYLGSYTFLWDLKENTGSCYVVFLGKIIHGQVHKHNLDQTELPFEARWVKFSDILNDQLPIRNNHAGLKPLLIKAMHSAGTTNHESCCR